MSSPETRISSSSKSLRDRDRSQSPTQYRSGPMPAPINVPSDPNASDARHSPTLARTFNPLDPDVRERQRTLDVDMAMQLSRARRVSTSSPAISPIIPHEHPHPHSLSSLSQGRSQHDTDDETMPMFTPFDTLHEDSEPMTLSPQSVSAITPSPPRAPSPPLAGLSHLNPHDPALLASPSPSPPPNLTPMQVLSHDADLPMYQHTPLVNAHSTFHFDALEDFARKEKAVLLRERGVSTLRQRVKTPAPPPQPSADDAFTLPPPRARKLSQSLGTPRRQHGGGKMALFENTAGGAPPLPLPGHLFATGHGGGHGGGGAPALSAVSSFENLPAPGAGHDERPYRFSFYSNALSATIHARSLAELPAEGQAFEELFTGSVSNGAESGPGSAPGSGSNSGAASGAASMKGVGNGAGSGEGGANGSSKTALGVDGVNGVSAGELKDLGAHTWWLDVLSPTDEEMRTLSQTFGIHPLTAEDIQMEEAREKIELFRTYYLVCFRSFDQDPYSPTYLEPLNMYIIVFREGTLSFHFRPSPHPQNVRRRIKQLKDYISVTSDWISYALIDDITDAFGPLIQSIEYEVDSIDELVLILKEAEQSDMLRRIGRCRKKVMGLLRLMGNKADVVKGLAKRCNENWKVAPTSDIGLYLSDIQDHLITMTQNLNHYEKILSRSHSNYLAQISIEMTDANNQINDVLSKLTALGTVLIPMNLVTGLWGMNVHVPGEDITTGYAWFLSIVGCLAVFALIGGYSTYKFMIG